MANQGINDSRDISKRHILNQKSFFYQWLILSFALIVIGGIIGINIFLEYGRTQIREQERLLSQTKVLQENIGQNLISTRDVLFGLRQYLPKGKVNADNELIARLKILTNAIPGIRTIAIMDSSGTWLASNRLEQIGKNFRQRDYFEVPRQQADEKFLYITPPYKTIMGEFSISVSVIIPGPKGEFAGVVMAGLDPSYFAPLLDSVIYAPDMWVGIAHWEGFIFMLRPDNKKSAGYKFQPGSFFFKHKKSGKETTVHKGIANVTSDDRLLVIRTVRPAGLDIPTPFTVAASRNLSAVFDNWRNESLKFLFLYGTIVLISVLGFSTFKRRQKKFLAERKIAEEELQKSEEKYRVLFEKSGQGILIVDLDTRRFIFANPAICQMLGYSETELQKKGIEDIHPKEAQNHVKSEFMLLVQGIKTLASGIPCLRKDGTVFYADINASSVIIINYCKCIVGFFADVTERINDEEALQKSEKKYRDLYEGSRDGFVLMNMKGDILEYNTAFRDMLGYTDEELITKTYKDFTPEKCQAMEAAIVNSQLMKNGYSNIYEKEYIRKDKTAFPVELRKYLIRDESGIPNNMWAFIRDISDRKEAENKLALVARELERSNKELDDFAYIASHDLKEPLRGIHNYASFLLEDYADKLDDPGKDKLNTLVYLSKRMESFINDLLKFSRISRIDLKMNKTKMDEVVKDALAIMKITLEQECVSIRIPRPLPTFECDHYQIVEVLQNLISNSIKYNDKPEKWIEISYTDDKNRADNKYTFYVRDNGIGIGKNYYESIFTIFKRLHGRDKFGGGTGAGLTIAKKIIERHGGTIWLESIISEGTTFYFTLNEEKNDHKPSQTLKT